MCIVPVNYIRLINSQRVVIIIIIIIILVITNGIHFLVAVFSLSLFTPSSASFLSVFLSLSLYLSLRDLVSCIFSNTFLPRNIR